MTQYAVSLTVSTDRPLTDEQAVQAATKWARNSGLVLGMTSTRADEPWLRVQGMLTGLEVREMTASVEEEATEAIDTLRLVLATLGVRVEAWHAVEILDEAEVRRRSERPTIPPLVNAEQFAELAGFKARQRIWQYETDRRTGKRDDFPAPVLEGYWLRSEAEHWAATRKTKPGPAKATTAGL